MNEHTKFKTARQVGDLANAEKRQPRGLTERIVWRAIGDLKQFPAIPRSIRIDSRLGPEGDTR